MAVTTFETIHKIFIEGSLDRANAISQGFAKIDFGFSSDKRLLQVRSTLTMQTRILPDYEWYQKELSPKWMFVGEVYSAGREPKRGSFCEVYDDYITPKKVYRDDYLTLHCSSEAPVIKPECLYMGGFHMIHIYAFFPVQYVNEDDYWGRIISTWEFED